jgi:hypothetical protein
LSDLGSDLFLKKKQSQGEVETQRISFLLNPSRGELVACMEKDMEKDNARV